jgi:hypothetical protein
MSTTSPRTSKIGLIAAFLCVVITTALTITAFWQHGVADDKVAEAERHENAASIFRQAEAEGQQVGTMLQEYVATGDATLVAQINERTSTAVTLLSTAVQESGIDGEQLVDGGSALVAAEGQIISLRQAGQVEQAIAGLNQLQTQFQAFLATQQGVIDNQEALAASARDDAETADGIVSWLVIGAAFFAIGAVASGIVHVRLTSSSRRATDAVPTA